MSSEKDKSKTNSEAKDQSEEKIPLPRSRHASEGAESTTSERVLPKAKVTANLLWTIVVSVFGSSFIFGFSIGAINAPQVLIQDWMRENHESLFKKAPSNGTMNIIYPAAVSLFAGGAMIGSLVSAILADRLGRKLSLHVNNVFAIVGSILMTIAPLVNVYPLFHIGRFIIGLNAGIGSSLVPLFLTEIAPVHMRGAIGTVPQFLVTASVLVSQIFGLPQIFGTAKMWPYIFAVTLVPSIFQSIAFFFVVESPKFTLIIKHNEAKATKDLATLRGVPEDGVAAEIKVIDKEANANADAPALRWYDLFKRPLLWPLFLACFLQCSQQLTGINAAMFYSTQIFRSAGLTGNWPVYATLIMGLVNVLQTIVSFYLIDSPRFGRRSLLLIGYIGMLFAMVLLTVAINLSMNNYSATITSWAPKGAILFVLLFVLSFATGPGSIPFFYVSEVFDSNARASASAMSTATNWTFNVLVGLCFPPINEAIGEYVFLIFAGFLLISMGLIVKYLPETKDKDLDEVHEEMNRKKAPCC
uniref:MFS domain-containing protein n=1 Tax=Panagrellus redivivus TaxID=6233 RepID=A0A7E4W721_PANRE